MGISLEGAVSILNKIKMRDWDKSHFELSGTKPNIWIESLEEKIDRREEFLNIIDTNRKSEKVAMLKKSELTE